MKKIREPKENDKEIIAIGSEILIKTIKSHPEIENSLWLQALYTVIMTAYAGAGITYQEFCEDWDSLKLNKHLFK
jgi:hypothetical protein